MKNLQMNDLINEINIALKETIPQSNLNTDLEESMLYSLNAGGKR
ncbi:polyprenyl synthetase family protein, partial [Staphylococcus ureilyticus]